MKAPKVMNRTHAKYEEACGLVDVIGLLDPHLKGKAAIGGNPFQCTLPMHQKGDRRMMRIQDGIKYSKPRWRCSAGCNGAKAEDTVTYLRLRLQMTHAEAITLWADLANSPREQWVGIVEQHRPNFFKRVGEARYVEEPVTDAEAEELQQKHLADGEATYFIDPKLNEALRSYKQALDSADGLTKQQAVVLFDALRASLETDDAA